MERYDYLIVGAGISGCTLAERLANVCGKSILIVEQRDHVGGNIYDCVNSDGILVHKYGPHIFHTDNRAVWDYLSSFTDWNTYQHKVLASVEGKLVPFPINIDTINTLYGTAFDELTIGDFYASVKIEKAQILNSEDVVLASVGWELYEKFFKNYTRKQWGLYPHELSAEVTRRIPVRENRDGRYFSDTWQGLPLKGYSALISAMLTSADIKVMLNTAYEDVVGQIRAGTVIYTGQLDRYFNYRLGALPYRSLTFEFETFEMDRYQPVAVINYPNEYDFTRIAEYKHMTGQVASRTTVSREYPGTGGEPCYPVPSPISRNLKLQYQGLAAAEPGVYFCGRLGSYRYLNMDAAVDEALQLFERLRCDKREV